MPDHQPAGGDSQSPSGSGAFPRRPGSALGAETPPPSPAEAGGAPKFCPHCNAEYDSALNFCPKDGNILQVRHGEHDLVGQVLGRHYRILELLGEGGMGQVFLAEHVRIGRRCAIKVMRPALVRDPGAVGRFGREATTAGRITHRNAAAVYDFGETEDGLIYIVMEHVDGPPLSHLLARDGALPPARASDIGIQICDALTAAHRLGIIHRDLKPDNILIARDEDGRDLVKVVDFGIAKALNDANTALTRTGFVLGTLQYMSPEQLIGEPLDGRSDLYSVGCILFEMLTGERTFAGPSGPAAVARRLTEPPPSPRSRNPAVPQTLDALVTRALARLADDRFPNAEELRVALKAALTELGGAQRTTGEAGTAPTTPAPARALTPGHQLPAGDAMAAASPTPPAQAGATAPPGSPAGPVSRPSPAPRSSPAATPDSASPRAGFAPPSIAAEHGPGSGTRPGALPLSAPTGGASGEAPPSAAARANAGVTPGLRPATDHKRRRLSIAVALIVAAGAIAGLAILRHARSTAAATQVATGAVATSGAPSAATPPPASAPPANVHPATVASAAAAPGNAPAENDAAPARLSAGSRVAAPAPKPATLVLGGALPPNARVFVDGHPARDRELARLSPGDHTVLVVAPGLPRARWHGSLASGETRTWIPRLAAANAAPPPAPAAPPTTAASAPAVPEPAPQSVPSTAYTRATPSYSAPAATIPQPAPPDDGSERLAALAARTRGVATDLAAAISARDPGALRRAWPGITPEAERRWQLFLTSFDNMQVNARVVDTRAPRVKGTTASAEFTIGIAFVNRASGRTSAKSRFVATYQWAGGEWVFTALRADE